jgi:predicted permease
MNTVLQDMRYAVRMLLKSPHFAVTVILILAVCIGANTALFSVLNGVLLNPLPYADSNRLVAVYQSSPGFDKAGTAYPNFLDWEKETHTLSSMAMYRNQDYNLVGTDEAERVSGYMVSANFFRTLGIEPVLGRAFRAEDDHLAAAPVAILGGGFWERKFASSPNVIGKSITLSGTLYTVIGVVPASFTFYSQRRDVYTPLGQLNDPATRDRRLVFSSGMLGRLRPGVPLPQAGADMERIARTLAATYPEADKGLGITLVPLKEDMTGNIAPFLLVLSGAVGFLLLLACANVANLLLARSMARSHEFAMRTALGGSQIRLIRQLLTESILLAGLGGGFGLLLALWATKAAARIVPATLPRANEVALDWRVLLFTVGVSLFAGIAFGLTPALKTSRINLQEILRESGRGPSAARHRLQGVFVAAEVAIALVLLVGAGLMVRSLAALWRVDPGFNPSHAVTFSLSMPAPRKTSPDATRAQLRAFDERMRTIPGVSAVSVTLGSRPMIHNSTEIFWIDGQPRPTNDSEMNQALFYLAESGFERAMGIDMERGRFITSHDDEHSPVVIVIDDVFARTYFPHQDPIGKRIHLAGFGVQAQIVGIAGHIKQWGLDSDAKSAIRAQFYYPFMQLPEKLMPLDAIVVAVVLRTKGDPAAMMGSVRRSVKEIDPREVIFNAETMNDVVANSFAARRVSMNLLSVFALLALALASVGIYGVISYLVSQRTQEIGLRMALGAQRTDVMRLVVGRGVRMALVGVALGVVAALGLTRLIAHQLFGVSAHDPLTFATVAMLLVLVAVAACYLPSRRAMNVDPIIALRYE